MLVCGYGPGISKAVARKFADEGYAVALVARTAEKLAAGAAELAEAGATARGFVCDLSDPEAVSGLVSDVRDALGPVSVIHWNAYAGAAGDLTSCDPAELRTVFDVGVTGLVAAVQAARDDLKAAGQGSVLVTGGGFALDDPQVSSMVVQWNTMGLALAKTAQHKLVALLHEKLKDDGVFVGEALVLGMVKGTAFDSGQATVDPADVADAFWTLHTERAEPVAKVR